MHFILHMLGRVILVKDWLMCCMCVMPYGGVGGFRSGGGQYEEKEKKICVVSHFLSPRVAINPLLYNNLCTLKY